MQLTQIHGSPSNRNHNQVTPIARMQRDTRACLGERKLLLQQIRKLHRAGSARSPTCTNSFCSSESTHCAADGSAKCRTETCLADEQESLSMGKPTPIFKRGREERRARVFVVNIPGYGTGTDAGGRGQPDARRVIATKVNYPRLSLPGWYSPRPRPPGQVESVGHTCPPWDRLRPARGSVQWMSC